MTDRDLVEADRAMRFPMPAQRLLDQRVVIRFDEMRAADRCRRDPAGAGDQDPVLEHLFGRPEHRLPVGRFAVHRDVGRGPDAQVVVADVELRGGLRAERLRLASLPDLGAPLLGMDVLGKLRLQQSDGVLRIDLHAAR